MDAYRSLLRPLLFQLDAETAHNLAVRVMATGFPWGLLGDRLFVADPRLQVSVGPLNFANPVGLAPGMDKNARAAAALQQMGFGYIIVGSIMPGPRPGNPRPRLRRLVDRESLMNCYGLPSDGLADCAARLARIKPGTTRVLANIDALALADYVHSFATVEPLVEAVEIGTRCPNNRDDAGDFEEHRAFEQLLQAIMPQRRKPVFVKVLPWRSEAEHQARMHLVEIGLHYGVDGFTLPGSFDETEPRMSIGRGHVTGRAAFPGNLKVVRELYALIRGKAAIKSLGGVFSGADAFAAIAAGATLVELLSAMVYEGWAVAHKINVELAALMAQHGYPSIESLRGSESVASQGACG